MRQCQGTLQQDPLLATAGPAAEGFARLQGWLEGAARTRCRLLVAGCWLLVAGCWLLAAVMALSSVTALVLQVLVSLQFSAAIYLLCGSNLVQALQSLAAAVCGSAACLLAADIKAKMLLLYGGVCAAGLLYDAGPYVYRFFLPRNQILSHGHEVPLVSLLESLLVPLTFVGGMAVSMKLYSEHAEASDSERLQLCQADESVDKTDMASWCHQSEEASFKVLLAAPLPPCRG